MRNHEQWQWLKYKFQTKTILVDETKKWYKIVNMYFIGNASIIVKPVGGGVKQGVGWDFDIFQKFAVKFPTPGAKM